MLALKTPSIVFLATGVILAALVLALTAPARAAVTLPDGFVQSQVVSGLLKPIDIEFAPDGRLYVVQQEGRLRVLRADGTLGTVLDISTKVDTNATNGLQEVSFDPNYAINRFIYLFYTHEATDTDGDGTVDIPLHSRIVRVRANQSGTGVVAGSEELLLRLDNLEPNGQHVGGSIAFGTDGKLYASVGDNNLIPSPAQSLGGFRGKIVRINKGGTIPSDNPFFDTLSGKKRAIWALGLRNPFRIAIDSVEGTIFINDVGSSGGKAREEINAGEAGANYGWRVCEGFKTIRSGEDCPSQYTDPVFAYAHGTTNTTGCSITGGAFYNPPTVQFPPGYKGDYFFADLCGGWIRRYDPVSDTVSGFATGLTRPIDFEVSEDGSLYVLQRRNANNPDTGSVHKIEYNPDTGSVP